MSSTINNVSSGGNLFAADLQSKVTNNELPSNVAADATALLNATGTTGSVSSGADLYGTSDASETSDIYATPSTTGSASLPSTGSVSTTPSTSSVSTSSASVSQDVSHLEGDASTYALQSGGTDTLDQAVFDAEALQVEQTAESGGDAQGTQLSNLFQQYCGMQNIPVNQANFSTFLQAFGSSANSNPEFAAAAQQVQSQLQSGDSGSGQFAWLNSVANLNGSTNQATLNAGLAGEQEPEEYFDGDGM